MSSGYELSEVKQKNDPSGLGPHLPDSLPEVTIVCSNDKSFRKPLDKYHLVYIILIIHGIGTLMPWNMFINAEDYFRNYKLNVTTSDQDLNTFLGDKRKNFLSYLSIAAQVPNLLFNGLNLLVNMGSGNLRLRVNLTLALETIIFTMTIILAIVDSSQWPVAFFYITMVSVVVLNMASGIYQNCIYGTGAIFPSTYTNAILIGSNASGTFTSVIDLLFVWLAPSTKEAAIYYFSTALLVILVCLISYNLLPQNQYFNHFDRSCRSPNQEDSFDLSTGNETSSRKLISDNSKDDVPDTLRETVDAMVPRPQKQPTFLDELKIKKEVFLKCWPQCLNVFLTFYVTLALFPSVLANVKPLQDTFSNTYFVKFACFFIFNVFAMIGNLISNWTTWPGRENVWMVVVARILFVPFFLFCNFNPKTRHWSVLIENDFIYIFGNIMFAITSGYLSSLCMMFASSGLKPDEASKAGMIAAFFLVLGIFLGVNSSFFLTWIVEIG